MGTIVGNVIEALKAAEIRADEAYPGGRIPALTGPVAAVRLGKVDRAVRTTTVQVIVMSPAAQGGAVCEATALRAIEALEAMSGKENICPVCGGQMQGTRWFSQPGHRYMDLATCPEDGKFLIRVRLSEQPDELIRVSRLTYEATSEAAEAYARRAEKADPEERRSSNHRRRRRRGGTKA